MKDFNEMMLILKSEHPESAINLLCSNLKELDEADPNLTIKLNDFFDVGEIEIDILTQSLCFILKNNNLAKNRYLAAEILGSLGCRF